MELRLVTKLFLILSLVLLLNLQLSKNIGADFDAAQWEAMFSGKLAADVAVFGSSHAANAVNPRLLEADGGSVWNFAVAGNSPSASLKWYRHVFRRYCKKPRLVIYQADWFLFDPDWLQLEYEKYSRKFPLRFFLSEMLDGDNDREALLMNRLPIFYNFDPRLLFHSGPAATIATYHGYAPNGEPPLNVNGKRFVSTRNDNSRRQAFEELLNALQADNVKVVLIQTPELLPARDCIRIKENNAYLQRVADAHGLQFLNYNGERVSDLNYRKEYYSDWGHLNGSGADAFTAVLRTDLSRLGSL